VDIHPSARKHGIADEDIEHASANALAIEDQDDHTRLYPGPARNAELLEIVTPQLPGPRVTARSRSAGRGRARQIRNPIGGILERDDP